MKFVKYHGLGNDFVIVDADVEKNIDFRAIAKKVCDRHFGIGADGLVPIRKLGERTWQMRIFNADGSECEMCGNVTRCVAHFLGIHGVINLETLAGTIRPELRQDETVRVDMGKPVLGEIVTLNGFEGMNVSMGNPHFVVFVDDLGKIDLAADGRALEVNSYFPNKSNIEFVKVLAPDRVRMRVWERGCGITMACGTGSCATVAAGVQRGLIDRRVVVKLDGGELEIEWNQTNGHVYMTGPAVRVFEGNYHVANQ